MKIIHALLLLAAIVLAGCSTTARLYNLDTGEVLSGTYENYGTGRGRITLKTSSGQVLSGEYTTISGAGMSFGSSSGTFAGGGVHGWATAQGFSFHQPGKQLGAATVVGAGMVIDIIYAVDPWSGNGHGVGRDNRGGRYRVHF